MTEEQPQNLPPDRSDGSNSDVESHDDVDALLAEASSLAGELSQEVGTGEPPVPPRFLDGLTDTPVEPTAETPVGSQDDVDAQLAELEDLARRAGSQIGDASEGPAEPGLQPDVTLPDDAASAREKGVKRSIPSFMEEFMHPQEPPAARSAPGDLDADRPSHPRALPAQPIPGVISSKTINDLPSFDDFASFDNTLTEGIGVGQQNEVGFGEPHSAGKRFVLPTPLRRLATRLSPMALAVCERGVNLLEKIDKPLGAIGRTPRRVIGWVAIATFTTSLIVLLISMFRRG